MVLPCCAGYQSPAANPAVSYLDVLDGGVFSEPVRQSCRPIARDPVETDIQVGEDAVFGEGRPEAKGALVAHSVSGKAQPTQPLSRVLPRRGRTHSRIDSAPRMQS